MRWLSLTSRLTDSNSLTELYYALIERQPARELSNQIELLQVKVPSPRLALLFHIQLDQGNRGLPRREAPPRELDREHQDHIFQPASISPITPTFLLQLIAPPTYLTMSTP